MTFIAVLLGTLAAWQLLSAVVLGLNNLSGADDGVKFGIASLGFILALGFLGLLLK